MKKIINWIKNNIKNDIKEIKEQYKNIKIEKLKKHQNFSWSLIIFAILFYEVQFYWPVGIDKYFISLLNNNVYCYFLILDLITLIIVIYAFKNELKDSFNNFKKNFKDYMKYLLFSLVIFAYLSAIVAIICNLIVGEIPDNQSALEQYNYLYLIFGSVIFAPIVEEIVYRGILRKFIKKDKLFIFISAILFGFAHVIGSSSPIQYIYVLDYGLSGLYLAFLYTKYNNIYLNISAHFFINLIATTSMLLRIIF